MCGRVGTHLALAIGTRISVIELQLEIRHSVRSPFSPLRVTGRNKNSFLYSLGVADGRKVSSVFSLGVADGRKVFYFYSGP